MAKNTTNFRVTFFDETESWADSDEGFETEGQATMRAKAFLNGAKDGAYVDVEEIKKVKRVWRSEPKSTYYK